MIDGAHNVKLATLRLREKMCSYMASAEGGNLLQIDSGLI